MVRLPSPARLHVPAAPNLLVHAQPNNVPVVEVRTGWLLLVPVEVTQFQREPGPTAVYRPTYTRFWSNTLNMIRLPAFTISSSLKERPERSRPLAEAIPNGMSPPTLYRNRKLLKSKPPAYAPSCTSWKKRASALKRCTMRK